MSGHSKWSTIKHKKGAADAKRGKIFSSLGKDITIAARSGGGDADLNPPLRAAITAAKNANMPNDNIDRAVKKGTGELAGGPLEELNYEGYGPGGVALIANCLTDNRNRTAANVRAAFNKYNGNLAGAGAVSWQFHRKALFTVLDADEETLLEILMEADVDVEDLTVEDGVAEILAPPTAFGEVADALEKAGIKTEESAMRLIPENTTPVTDVSTAKQLMRLIDVLEDDEDVQEVVANFEMTDELMDEVAG